VKGLTFHYVSDVKEVIELALLKEKVDHPKDFRIKKIMPERGLGGILRGYWEGTGLMQHHINTISTPYQHHKIMELHRSMSLEGIDMVATKLGTNHYL